MTIILIFAAVSVATSALTVSACMMSSRISQQGNLVEKYDNAEVILRTASQTSF